MGESILFTLPDSWLVFTLIQLLCTLCMYTALYNWQQLCFCVLCCLLGKWRVEGETWTLLQPIRIPNIFITHNPSLIMSVCLSFCSYVCHEILHIHFYLLFVAFFTQRGTVYHKHTIKNWMLNVNFSLRLFHILFQKFWVLQIFYSNFEWPMWSILTYSECSVIMVFIQLFSFSNCFIMRGFFWFNVCNNIMIIMKT